MGSTEQRAVALRIGQNDLKFPDGKRQAALIDKFPDAGEKILSGFRECTANHDETWVEDADDIRRHFANRLSGPPNQHDGLRSIGFNELHDVACIFGRESPGRQVAGDRPATRARFHTAQLSATAQGRIVRRKLNVTDVAGCTLSASKYLAARDDSAADACSRLDKEHVFHMRKVLAVFTDRHEVHVVFDEDRRLIVPSEPASDVKLIPFRENRRADDTAAFVIDGGRKAQTDGEEQPTGNVGSRQ